MHGHYHSYSVLSVLREGRVSFGLLTIGGGRSSILTNVVAALSLRASSATLSEYSPAVETYIDLDLLTPTSDWERAIVEWAKGSDGNWVPGQLLLSQHSGYDRLNWTDIQNTFNTADASLQRGGDNGRQNLDHPKVRSFPFRLFKVPKSCSGCHC